MVSHGHGQGYADLHFLIPETVDDIGVFKGPYFAEYGNLATAGAVSFKTKDHIDRNFLQFEGGQFGTNKMTALLQIPTVDSHQNAYFAGQVYQTDGPVISPQDFKRFNLFSKFHSHFSEKSRFSLSMSAFGSAWNASGQIPQRAVDNGVITRFGALDAMEGGVTGRQNFNLEYLLNGAKNSRFKIQAFASKYNFKLFSNFTFFLEDAINGDMIEQVDNRQVTGLNSTYKFSKQIGSVFSSATIGGGFRADDISVALWKSPQRIRLKNLTDSEIAERNFYLWIQEEFFINRKLSLQLGLRGDYFTFDVQDNLDNPLFAGKSELPHASGYQQQAILSPKMNVVFSPSRSFDIFLNTGSGFHSNDARDVIIGSKVRELTRALSQKGWGASRIDSVLLSRKFDPQHRSTATLPRAIGGEIGLRAHLFDRLNIGISAWALDLGNEFVYVGDAGTTELSGATRRIGFDLEGRMAVLSWLWADCDLSVSDGRFQNEPQGRDYIPLAPRLAFTGGFTMTHPCGFDGSLRIRQLDSRPANEDNTVIAKGYTLINMTFAYKFGAIKIIAALENIFDEEWNEAQFDTESRLKNELNPVSEIHFTPGNPRNIRMGMRFEF